MNTPREMTKSGKSAMQVLAAFRCSGAVAWPTCDISEIFVAIEWVSAPRWRGFPGNLGSWALSPHHPAFLTSLVRPPRSRSLMDKKDNIRYVSLLFSAFHGPIVGRWAPPVSALSELGLLGHRV